MESREWKNIDIWDDKWITGHASFKPRTPDLNNEGPLNVSFLIHPSLNEWDLPILTYLFWQEDIEEILKIPLASKDSADVLVWHFTKHGCYSVSSAYHLAMSIKAKQQDQLAGSSSHVTRHNWNFVLDLKITNKVKHFSLEGSSQFSSNT